MNAVTPLTPQQVFDAALFGLRKQGCASSAGADDDGRAIDCAYRAKADDGSILKCGIGHAIPDSLYEGRMDCYDTDTGIITLLTSSKFPALNTLLSACDPELLEALQYAHDLEMPGEVGGSMDEWERRMRGIAAVSGLVYTPPTTDSKE